MTTRYRVCAEPGCPNVTEGHARCDDCRAAHERQRGTRTARGYGPAHQAAKRHLRTQGHTHCANCGVEFTSDNPMQTGHIEAIRNGGTLAAGAAPHCGKCNQGWRSTHL